MDRTVSESRRSSHSASLVSFGALSLATPLLAMPGAVHAGDWLISPSLEAAEIFTDNVNLAPDARADSEAITEITPGISIQGEGARLRGFAEYRMQNLFYLSEPDRSTTNHQFLGSGTAEVREDSLFLDAEARATQVLIDPDTFSGDSISGVNRTDVYTMKLSPYFVHDFGGTANLLARYTNAMVRYDSTASNTDLNQVDVSLTSGRRFTRLGWGLSYYAADYDQERRTLTSGDAEHRVASANVSYAITRRFALLGQAGDEFHEYEVPTRGFRNGSYTAGGFRWRPTRRSSISALFGDRYESASVDWQPSQRTSVSVRWRDTDVGVNVGEAWDADASLFTRHTRWGLRYVEDSGITQQLDFIGQPFGYLGVVDGRLVFEADPFAGAIQVPVTQDLFPLTNEAFRRERGEVYFILDRPRSSVFVRVYDEDRFYLTSGDEERTTGMSSFGSWRFARLTSWIGSVDIARRELRLPAGVEDDLWRVETGLQRQLGPRSVGSLTVSRAERDSSLGGRDYTENRITLRVMLRL